MVHFIASGDAGYNDLANLFYEATTLQEQPAPMLKGPGCETFVREQVEVGASLMADSELPFMRPPIVCLCGSTRFGSTFHEANLRETLAGYIVLSIGCNLKSDADLLLAGEMTSDDKARLDELHLRKIDLADAILVLNVGGYVGESTRREIAYAHAHGKAISWWEA